MIGEGAIFVGFMGALSIILVGSLVTSLLERIGGVSEDPLNEDIYLELEAELRDKKTYPMKEKEKIKRIEAEM